MTKTEIKNEAKKIVAEQLAVAYYRLESMDEFTEEESMEISNEVTKIAMRLQKQIGQPQYVM